MVEWEVRRNRAEIRTAADPVEKQTLRTPRMPPTDRVHQGPEFTKTGLTT